MNKMLSLLELQNAILGNVAAFRCRRRLGIVKLKYHKLRQPQDMASETASEYLIWWLAPSATS